MRAVQLTDDFQHHQLRFFNFLHFSFLKKINKWFFIMMDFFIRLTLLEYFYCVCVCTTKRGPLIDLGFFF